MARVGDYSNKQYLYKFYRRGYSSWHNKYIDIANGQYIGHTVEYLSGDPTSVNPTSLIFMVSGAGGSSEGVSTTDLARPISITGVNALFNPTYSAGGLGTSISYFYLELLGYKVNYNISSSQVQLYKDGVLVDTKTLSSSYDYIRIREDDGDLIIENSSNGTTWTAWYSFTIDYDTDIISSPLKFGFDVSAGGSGNAIIGLGDVLITDKAQQLLGIESENVTSELTFDTEINTPASKTTVTLNYAPGEVPDYIKLGNNMEAYANFYDWESETDYQPILDQNGDPILDQNSQIIYSKVLNQGTPDNINNLKFSGYIDSIDYDYDTKTIAVTVVSHGELMANVLVYGEDVESSILKQELYNASVATTVARYQTVRFYKQVKIDSLAFRWSATGGGAMSYTIATSSGTNIATSETLSWGGGLSVGVYKLNFNTPVYLEPGVYRIGLEPSPASYTISYQNTNVYPDGSWSGGAGDLYFNIFTELPSFNELLSGTSDVLVGELFNYLDEKYTLIRQGDVDVSDYTIQIQTSIDTTLSVMERIQSQSNSGWWWYVDPGTNYLTLQEPDTTPDHILVLGRDFTQFKLSESIGDIVNTAIFTGGEISEGVNLAVLAQDFNSIAKYKYGLDISSNEKVTRFDSASLLVNNTIANNKNPRYTTDITVSAAVYDIETFKVGHLVKLTNGDSKLNSLLLTVAGLSYSPTSITLNLDTAPVSINKTVEAIRRELQNASTANVQEVN